MPDGDDKSFPATPKRREQARKQGNVARSPEFSAASTLLAMVLALHAALPGPVGHSLMENVQLAFRFSSRDLNFNVGTAQSWQIESLYWIGRIVVPALALAIVMGVGVNIGQVGFHVTPEALAPKWDRLNPINGVKRLFSMRGSVELMKGILKMSLIGFICYASVRDALDNGGLLSIMGESLTVAMSVVGSILWHIGLRVAVALFILAVADYAYQKYDYEKNLKMSASEIKQEMKDVDGDPHTKARVRRLQREMSKKRMMKDVPKADVVITNPTHFAVALLYENDGKSTAPKVVAKGQDFIALQIKELARENKVPIVENKPLAQQLFKTVEVGQEIPGDLYTAVAEVLAFVYRTNGKRPRAKKPRRRLA